MNKDFSWKNMKSVDWQVFTYSGISIVFVITVLVAFTFASRFLTREINKIFITEAASNSFAVDPYNYKLVADKLGLPIHTVETIDATDVVEEIAPVLNKKDILIGVFNGSGVTGAAAKLKTALEASGYTVIKTGNESPSVQTTVDAKLSKKQYLDLLLPELGSYNPTATTTLLETNELDVVIIIGTN